MPSAHLHSCTSGEQGLGSSLIGADPRQQIRNNVRRKRFRPRRAWRPSSVTHQTCDGARDEVCRRNRTHGAENGSNSGEAARQGPRRGEPGNELWTCIDIVVAEHLKVGSKIGGTETVHGQAMGHDWSHACLFRAFPRPFSSFRFLAFFPFLASDRCASRASSFLFKPLAGRRLGKSPS